MEIEPLLVGIPVAGRILGVGRSTTYKLMDAEDLKSVKIRGRRLITVTSIKQLAARLVAAA